MVRTIGARRLLIGVLFLVGCSSGKEIADVMSNDLTEDSVAVDSRTDPGDVQDLQSGETLADVISDEQAPDGIRQPPCQSDPGCIGEWARTCSDDETAWLSCVEVEPGCLQWANPTPCDEGQTCSMGFCSGPCVPQCGDNECGPDYCGGSCGNCSETSACYEGACVESSVDATLTVDDTLCKGNEPFLTSFCIQMSWTTSVPATSEVEFDINGTSPVSWWTVEEEATTTHEFEGCLNGMHFWPTPQVGDVIRLRARVTAMNGDKGVSNSVEVPVDEAARVCLWPYDEQCSDGGGVMCRMPPPQCGDGRVLAAIGGCYACLFPDTCNCNDGSLVFCEDPAAVACEPGTVYAVQDGCVTCVDPVTCE